MEITMNLKLKPDASCDPLHVLTAKFVMVSRDPMMNKAIACVTLKVESQEHEIGVDSAKKGKHPSSKIRSFVSLFPQTCNQRPHLRAMANELFRPKIHRISYKMCHKKARFRYSDKHTW
ncbi:hypothetical protein L596_020694 [Steinernema carpocapsae]|uniref:Uncharacterized protein n=1 Tax=Steinernema carpocapsae TaxID=34508 RepID=A0A4U5MUD5_STECR|nr:hypothetical protein L596_020694 [Steinernema carpocapsae]